MISITKLIMRQNELEFSVCFTVCKIFLHVLFHLILVVAQEEYPRRQWQPIPVLLPGKSHGQRSLVGCCLWDRIESDMTERLHFSLSCIGEGNGNPLQCSCLENPREGGAWWAAVYGVAESDTTEAPQQQQQQEGYIHWQQSDPLSQRNSQLILFKLDQWPKCLLHTLTRTGCPGPPFFILSFICILNF